LQVYNSKHVGVGESLLEETARSSYYPKGKRPKTAVTAVK